MGVNSQILCVCLLHARGRISHQITREISTSTRKKKISFHADSHTIFLMLMLLLQSAYCTSVNHPRLEIFFCRLALFYLRNWFNTRTIDLKRYCTLPSTVFGPQIRSTNSSAGYARLTWCNANFMGQNFWTSDANLSPDKNRFRRYIVFAPLTLNLFGQYTIKITRP